MELKKEAKRREEEQNNTFKPQLITRKKSASNVSKPEADAAVPADPVERLHSGTGPRKKAEEERHQRKEITAAAKPAPKPARKSDSFHADKPSVDAMYRAHGAGRPKQSAEEAPKESFTPQISKLARAKSMEARDGNKMPLGERLYAHAAAEKAKKEELRLKLLREEEEKCTFSPAITPAAAARADEGVPLVERMNAFQAAKQKKIEDALKEKESKERAAATFRPVINAKPEQPGEEHVDVVERMMQDIEARTRKSDAHVAAAESHSLSPVKKMASSVGPL